MLPGKQLHYLKHLTHTPWGASRVFLRALLVQIAPGVTKQAVLSNYSTASHPMVCRAIQQLIDDRQVVVKAGSHSGSETSYELAP